MPWGGGVGFSGVFRTVDDMGEANTGRSRRPWITPAGHSVQPKLEALSRHHLSNVTSSPPISGHPIVDLIPKVTRPGSVSRNGKAPAFMMKV